MRSASEAVVQARRYTTYRRGRCLQFVQTMFAAPWSGPSASWAWQHARYKHHGDKNPPRGVPVLWTGGSHGYGHIAVSLGGGMCRSTDMMSPGHVSDVSIDHITRSWGLHYEGWVEDLGGQRIRGIGGPSPKPHQAGHRIAYVNKLRYGQKDSDSVRYMQQRLIQLGFSIPAGATGTYGPQTDSAVRGAQRKWGNKVDPKGRSSLGPRQAARLFAGTGVVVRP